MPSTSKPASLRESKACPIHIEAFHGTGPRKNYLRRKTERSSPVDQYLIMAQVRCQKKKTKRIWYALYSNALGQSFFLSRFSSKNVMITSGRLRVPKPKNNGEQVSYFVQVSLRFLLSGECLRLDQVEDHDTMVGIVRQNQYSQHNGYAGQFPQFKEPSPNTGTPEVQWLVRK